MPPIMHHGENSAPFGLPGDMLVVLWIYPVDPLQNDRGLFTWDPDEGVWTTEYDDTLSPQEECSRWYLIRHA